MENEITIKKATIDNLEDIRQLNNDLFEYELTHFDDTLIENWPLTKKGKDYFEDLILNHFVFIACCNNEIVGYIAGIIQKISINKNKYGEISNIFIKENIRGKKVGTKLYEAFLNEMKKNNINELRVTASFKNKKARSFYETKGFIEHDITYKINI